MKVIIFGGAGFVGLNVAEALLARGHDVTLYDRAAAAADPRERRVRRLPGAKLTEVFRAISLDAKGIDALIAEGL